MHEFRKRSRDPRQALDGFLSAPQRQHMGRQAAPRDGLSDRLHTTGRRVDNFKQTEGYHSATRSISHTAPPVHRPSDKTTQAATREKQASMLHMTLPGGILETTKKQRKSKTKSTTKWGKFRKWGLRSGLAVVGIVLLMGGFLVVKGLFQANKVFKGGGQSRCATA